MMGDHETKAESHKRIAAQNKAMRSMHDVDRLEAIDLAGNVIGYELFVRRARHVQLTREYKRTPPAGGPSPA